MGDREDGLEPAIEEHRSRAAARAVRRRGGRALIVALITVGVLVVAGLVVVALPSPAGDSPSSSAKPATAGGPVAPVADAALVTSAPPAPPTEPDALSPIATQLVKSVPTAGKRVALTFDLCERDGDTAGYDEALVAVLRESGVKATFFMGGKWAQSHPEQAASLGAAPLFEIGNHSWSHLDLAKTTPEQTEEQILRGQEAIWRLTGRTPVVFRFPFGTYNPRSLAAVCQHGLVPIEWNVVTGDPDKNIHAADIVSVIKKKTRNGAIIIMHANGRGWHTAEALPQVLSWLRAQGYEPMTVSELLATQ